jgi:dynein heavy chain 1
VTGWLPRLPEGLEPLEATDEAIKNPLFRFFNREIGVMSQLLAKVRADLAGLLAVAEGDAKLTNEIGLLKDSLIKGVVPHAWRGYQFPAAIPTSVWVTDFVDRIMQYQRIATHARAGRKLGDVELWIGGVMEPAAFFTASRQAVAAAENVSLEQLRMELSVQSASYRPTATEIKLSGLRFEGILVEGATAHIVEELFRSEPCTALRWVTGEPGFAPSRQVQLPIYLHCARQGVLIDTVAFEAAPGTSQGVFYERGAAVICSPLGGAI